MKRSHPHTQMCPKVLLLFCNQSTTWWKCFCRTHSVRMLSLTIKMFLPLWYSNAKGILVLWRSDGLYFPIYSVAVNDGQTISNFELPWKLLGTLLFFFEFTTPSAVNLSSPWMNAERDSCSYGSHALYIKTISLQVLSTLCHSQVKSSQQLQKNSSDFSEFFFNTAKIIHLKTPATTHIFHTLLVSNRFCI